MKLEIFEIPAARDRRRRHGRGADGARAAGRAAPPQGGGLAPPRSRPFPTAASRSTISARRRSATPRSRAFVAHHDLLLRRPRRSGGAAARRRATRALPLLALCREPAGARRRRRADDDSRRLQRAHVADARRSSPRPSSTPIRSRAVGGSSTSAAARAPSAAAAARRAPALDLTLFDLPPVAERARARVRRARAVGRVTVVGGDMLRDPLPQGADVATLVRVLHDHDDEVALARSSPSVRDALPQNGDAGRRRADGGSPRRRADGRRLFRLLSARDGPRPPPDLRTRSPASCRQAGFRPAAAALRRPIR